MLGQPLQTGGQTPAQRVRAIFINMQPFYFTWIQHQPTTAWSKLLKPDFNRPELLYGTVLNTKNTQAGTINYIHTITHTHTDPHLG